MLTRTDFLVSHELKLGDGNKRLRLELNLLNTFNQKTSRHQLQLPEPRGGCAAGVFRDLSGATSTSATATITTRCIQGSPDGANAYDPRFDMDDIFEPGTQGYFTVRFIF